MNFDQIPLHEKQEVLMKLREVKEAFAARNWFPGTAGNLSIRIGEYTPEKFNFGITASGKDKYVNTSEDFLFVDQDAVPCEATNLKPSAETLVHCEIYRKTGAGAIFHIHSVFSNVISEYFWHRRSIPVDGVELIKGLNIWEEEYQLEIPIVSNFLHIPSIIPEITEKLDPKVPGIVLRKHGVYAWGANAFEAKRHLESFEFIFEYVYRLEMLKKGLPTE
ncbi:MAG TPA: methylthioribulose 1-phosphate dehydratase [Candidatus Paenibacillus intestinavium]|nr:methylthioribulose 1-phosphate dehydratase [Candidatus Paenibacillus intestinavium]